MCSEGELDIYPLDSSFLYDANCPPSRMAYIPKRPYIN